MNPLNSVKGSIITGVVLVVILVASIVSLGQITIQAF